MKLRNLFLTALCATVLTAGFTSCSDNDTPSWKDGAKIDLPDYRGFVLSEGAFGKNNSHLFFVNPQTGEPYATDIFEAQNGKKLGDTANDMIAYNGNIYVIVNVSKMLFKLNGSGVLQAAYSFKESEEKNPDKSSDADLGEPRYIVAQNGKLYVTCYGGYVARFDANTLAFEAKVKTDANPEEIVTLGGQLFCVCSGMGTGNTLNIIDIAKFGQTEKAESVTTLDNPIGIKEANGHIYVLALGFYDENWNNDPKVGVFNIDAKTTTEIAKATRVMADGDKLYIANSTSPDWVNYTTTLSTYNATDGTISAWNLKGEGAKAVTGGNVYMIEKNPYDGSFFIATTDYVNNSPVYHFAADGSYIGMFSAGGINANSMLFFR